MTYRDDDHSRVPDSHPSQYAMVGSHHPGDALVAQSNGAPAPSAMVPAAPTYMPQDVLRGGMDANTFLHALRRRWILALCMGVLAGTSAAIALWMLFPKSTTATALFRVASQAPTIFTEINRYNEQNFEILQKTQLAALKSHFVLSAAIRNPGVASLSALAGEDDPVLWLQENLDVEFLQQSEYLSISLTSDDPPEDLRLLVDAVAKAYKDEVIYEERQRRLITRDALARTYTKLQKDVTESMREFYNIAGELGLSDAENTNALTNIMLSQIEGLAGQRADLETRLIEMQTNYQVYSMRLEDPQMIEAQIDAMLAADPQVAMWQQQLMGEQMQAITLSGVAKGGRSRQIVNQQQKIAQIQQQIAQYRAQVKQNMKNEQRSAPNMQKTQLTKEFRLQFTMLKNQLDAVKKAYDDKFAELQSKVKKSVDLESQKAEMEQLREIAKDMSIKLESLEIEADAPDRINIAQQAVVSPNINTAQRATIATVGGLASLGLVCFGIGYLEFRNRRLNGPDQVDEGLGIRVVGTLPSLSARRALDPAHPIVAQLTESIDSVRTILMHDSTTKKRQVVLVTSAMAMEGRTTVASQLAASLARAGRRTLLVDGDLRRPALHALFDVPLEDGLCEVLRAEVDAADVIRPTHAEGLWLLTAGYCDVDAIHALATEQMQPVFDKLRAEYDFIIIDGAPVIGMSDALIFGQYSDGAILSVRRDHSQMPKINHAAELLRGVGIRIIGSVVNGVPTKADDRVTQLRLIAPKAERTIELEPVG